MYIACWSCGQEVWIDNQKECRQCGAIARRCADCHNYMATTSTCTQFGTEVPRHEAQKPGRLALSINCASYAFDPVARQRQERLQAQEAASTPAPATPTRSAPPPTPTVETPGAPALAADVEVITIVREPAPRRPKHPIVIAHRGDSSSAPENTLTAIKSALANGAQAVEFDVQISKDGQAVVIHDATVDRCSAATGAVRDMTLEELRALDVGSWFGPEFSAERIPTLAEAISAVPVPALLIVHLRAHENETDCCERAVADAIDKCAVHGRSIVAHHTRHGLQRLREMDAKLHLCWIGPGGDAASEYVDDAYYMGYRFIQPMARDVDEKLVAYAHERGMWVSVFWADELDDMRRLIALGVDGIITNRPALLRQTVREAIAGTP